MTALPIADALRTAPAPGSSGAHRRILAGMEKDRSTLKAVLIGLGAVLYGASPIDLVPEILAGPLGFGDDAVVLIGAGVAIWRIMRNRNARRRAAAAQPAPPQYWPSDSPR